MPPNPQVGKEREGSKTNDPTRRDTENHCPVVSQNNRNTHQVKEGEAEEVDNEGNQNEMDKGQEECLLNSCKMKGTVDSEDMYRVS